MSFLRALRRVLPIMLDWSSLVSGGHQDNTPVDAPFYPDESYKRVKIGPVELGIRDFSNPDFSKPNPSEIKWWRENNVVEHPVVGHKPLTQCTEPDTLWHCSIRLSTLADQDTATSHFSENLKKLAKMNAGPWMVEDSFTTHGLEAGRLCMYLKKPEFTQKAGTKDWYRIVDLQLVEANDGLSEA